MKKLGKKKSPLNMRTTPSLRRKIENSAKASGRSLVQEVEYRIEASFQRDEMAAAIVHVMESKIRVAVSQSVQQMVRDELLIGMVRSVFKEQIDSLRQAHNPYRSLQEISWAQSSSAAAADGVTYRFGRN